MTARRYEPLLKIASGGTASVWVGAAAGALGFRQLVAIKRPHEHLADDPAFVAALVEEAKLASRLRHANVVDVRDVEADEHGIQLVMDWVEGASLSDLIRAWQKEPPVRPHAVAIRIALDACEGLRSLHELASDEGKPLGCVHRDVSPANVLVGLDGVARITDFGLARPLLAVERTTSQGALRGKLGYMAPEYIRGKAIDHRVDVFAMGVVVWETLARRRLFRGENDAATLERVQREPAPRLAEIVPEIGPAAGALDALLERALTKDPALRTSTIAELATELERLARAHDILASHTDVRDAFGVTLRTTLDERRREVQRVLAEREEVASLAPSVPPASLPSHGTAPPPAPTLASDALADDPVAVSVASPRRLPARSWVVLGGLALVALAGAGVRIGMRSLDAASVPVRPSVRTIDSDLQGGDGDVRPRAPSIPPTAAPVRSAKAPQASPPAGARHEGDKPPRPNPYAEGKSAGRANRPIAP